jgi:hypothetical protein
MRSEGEIRAETTAQGLRIKRNNFLAALLTGGALVWTSLHFFPHSIPGILAGFVPGFFYANAFEYCLHRFILHSGSGFFFDQHMVHHQTLNSPEAPLALQWIFKNRWTAGMFVAFTLYYIAFEEVHWRAHMGGRLPKRLRFAARHHLLHHAHERGEYNVFLPICDWLVGTVWPRPGMHAGAAGK